MRSTRPSPLATLRLLALLAALCCGLAGAASAAGRADVCKPDPDCRPLCRAKARSVFHKCVEDGGSRAECRRKARELRSACSADECGGDCERRCGILGQRLLQGCIADGGELDACRAEADMATDACIERGCRACVCPDVYRPVCGVDGVTYGNACEAACARVTVEHDGPCEPRCPPLRCEVACEFGNRTGPDGCSTCECNPPPGCRTDEDCGQGQQCREICSLRPCRVDEPDCAPCFGVCLPEPEPCVCPEVYQPVCGANGKTYPNACHAGCAGVPVAHEGECRPQCAIQCFRYDPVCGTDGVTYGCGAADAHCHGTEVKHEGECRPACGPDESCPS